MSLGTLGLDELTLNLIPDLISLDRWKAKIFAPTPRYHAAIVTAGDVSLAH